MYVKIKSGNEKATHRESSGLFHEWPMMRTLRTCRFLGKGEVLFAGPPLPALGVTESPNEKLPVLPATPPPGQECQSPQSKSQHSERRGLGDRGVPDDNVDADGGDGATSDTIHAEREWIDSTGRGIKQDGAGIVGSRDRDPCIHEPKSEIPRVLPCLASCQDLSDKPTVPPVYCYGHRIVRGILYEETEVPLRTQSQRTCGGRDGRDVPTGCSKERSQAVVADGGVAEPPVGDHAHGDAASTLLADGVIRNPAAAPSGGREGGQPPWT